MSKNVVEPGRPQTIRRTRFAFLLSNATRAQAHASGRAPTHTYAQTFAPCSLTRKHTHKYVILISFPQQQWLRERVLMLRYTYIACLVFNF